MAADSNTDGPGTPIRHKRTTNFNQIIHNYYAVPIFITKSRFLGLCVPHTCLVGFAPMSACNIYLLYYIIIVLGYQLADLSMLSTWFCYLNYSLSHWIWLCIHVSAITYIVVLCGRWIYSQLWWHGEL